MEVLTNNNPSKLGQTTCVKTLYFLVMSWVMLYFFIFFILSKLNNLKQITDQFQENQEISANLMQNSGKSQVYQSNYWLISGKSRLNLTIRYISRISLAYLRHILYKSQANRISIANLKQTPSILQANLRCNTGKLLACFRHI